METQHLPTSRSLRWSTQCSNLTFHSKAAGHPAHWVKNPLTYCQCTGNLSVDYVWLASSQQAHHHLSNNEKVPHQKYSLGQSPLSIQRSMLTQTTCPSPKSAWTGTRLKDCHMHITFSKHMNNSNRYLEGADYSIDKEGGGWWHWYSDVCSTQACINSEPADQQSCQDQCTEGCLCGCKEEVEQVEGPCHWLHHLGTSSQCWCSSPLLNKGPVCHKTW